LSIQGSGENSEWIQFRLADGNNKWHVNHQGGVLNFVETGEMANRLVLAPGGNVGIGTATPGAKLEVSGQVKITGGSPGAGKVLTSDATGTATWQPAVAPAAGAMLYWNGTVWLNVSPGITGHVLTFANGIPTWEKPAIPNVGLTDVYNHATGKVWMDRNLGATQVASSSTDAASYGGLYQWGRAADGHQIRSSGTTSTLSSTDTPGHGLFILAPNSPYDWRSPQNTGLWQGVSGTNNPCPSGYRLPTDAEWNAERLSWSSNNSAGAFASPLKLPLAGYRALDDVNAEGSIGGYWSSTVDGTYSVNLFVDTSNAVMSSDERGIGLSVRCIKD
jgi:uncharacterized protein (TIGR02145 family)